MSDTENPAPEAAEQQQEAAAEENETEQTEQAAVAETEESQPQQDDVAADAEDKPADSGAVVGDVDGVAADDNGAGGEQEESAPAEEERQPTPAAQQEEQAEAEVKPETPQAEQEEEQKVPEPVPEPEPEQEEPANEPVTEQDQEQPRAESSIKMSEEDLKRCQHLFGRKAVDGQLDLRGFKVVCRLMGEVLSAHDAEEMFCDGQRDDSATIDFEEFCGIYVKHSEEESARKAAMMSSIDKLFPSSEPVELKKVKGLLMKMQSPDLDMRLVREKSDLNPSDISHLVNSMDKHGNGLISKQEFVDTLCKHLEHC